MLPGTVSEMLCMPTCEAGARKTAMKANKVAARGVAAGASSTPGTELFSVWELLAIDCPPRSRVP